jgi:hypothetical protein
MLFALTMKSLFLAENYFTFYWLIELKEIYLLIILFAFSHKSVNAVDSSNICGEITVPPNEWINHKSVHFIFHFIFKTIIKNVK